MIILRYLREGVNLRKKERERIYTSQAFRKSECFPVYGYSAAETSGVKVEGVTG